MDKKVNKKKFIDACFFVICLNVYVHTFWRCVKEQRMRFLTDKFHKVEEKSIYIYVHTLFLCVRVLLHETQQQQQKRSEGEK